MSSARGSVVGVVVEGGDVLGVGVVGVVAEGVGEGVDVVGEAVSVPVIVGV